MKNHFCHLPLALVVTADVRCLSGGTKKAVTWTGRMAYYERDSRMPGQIRCREEAYRGGDTGQGCVCLIG